MKKRRIGVMIEPFRLGGKEEIRKASRLGADRFLTIEREVGGKPVEDITRAVDLLRTVEAAG